MYLYATLSDKFILLLRRGYWRSLLFDPTSQNRVAPPAFGQHSVEGELVPSDDEQQVIEIIRRHHKSGKSLRAIAQYLNENGYKSKRGKDWQHTSVKTVLDRLYPKIA